MNIIMVLCIGVALLNLPFALSGNLVNIGAVVINSLAAVVIWAVKID